MHQKPEHSQKKKESSLLASERKILKKKMFGAIKVE